MRDINSADLEKRYAAMSDEELAALRRSDLTPQAASIYDQELTRRPLFLSQELRARNQSEAEAVARREALEPPGDPKPELGALATISIVIFVIGTLFVFFLFANGVDAGVLAGRITCACLPGLIGFNLYLQRKRAWNDRRKERELQQHAFRSDNPGQSDHYDRSPINRLGNDRSPWQSTR